MIWLDDQQTTNPQHTISDVRVALRLDVFVATLSDGNTYKELSIIIQEAQLRRVSARQLCILL